MEIFLNRLDICFNNAILTKDIKQKEVVLNRVLLLLRYFKLTMDLFDSLYKINSESYMKFINSCKPSLILMSYDLISIGKAINIPDNMYITYTNNSFYIEYTPTSPKSESSDSLHSEWGYSSK